MRIPTYLSHSGMSLWESNPEEYYLKNIAPTRAPRLPQEKPASVGSCFDAFAKSALHEALFGKGADPVYSFEALFEAQVEPHNRDWVLEEGRYTFDCYKYSGMYQSLLDMLLQAVEPPRFEFSVFATLGGVPFTGKPDCRFILPGPIHVIHDWKVNGYCSNSATSPVKGYLLCTDGEPLYKTDKKTGVQTLAPNKSHNTAHKQFAEFDHHGLTIDAGYMEDLSTDWADQLSLYGWALGEKIGDQNVVLQIHQTVAKPIALRRPQLRFAQFRCRVRDSYQHHLLGRLQTAWKHISTGHIIPTLTRAENDARCRALDKESIGLQSDGSIEGDFFAAVVRPKYRG